MVSTVLVARVAPAYKETGEIMITKDFMLAQMGFGTAIWRVENRFEVFS